MRLEHYFFEVDNVGAEQMCSGKLFQATGPCSHGLDSIDPFL